MSNTIPEGWSTQALDGKIHILSGFPFQSSLFCDDSARMGVIRIRDLVKQSIETFYAGDFEDVYVVKKGDILIGMDGDFTIVKWNAKDALLNQRVCKVKAEPGSGFDTNFLFYSLADDLISINAATGATTVKHLSVKDIRGIEKVYPPLPEQQKIATILSSVDDVIEKTRAQIDKLKDLKTGMMQELLTKGVGHTEFKDSPVGRIPVSWDVLYLEELVKAEKNITYGIVQAGAHHDGGVPYIRVSDMTKRALSRNGMLLTSPEIAEKYQRSAVSCGDIVYALRGVIGHVLVVPKELDGANLTQGTARISPNDKVDSGYLLWAMKSPYVNEQNDLAAKGSTFREVTLASLRKIQVALPELSEQKKIASIFDSVELNIFSIEDKLAHLKSIKKALMQDLLTGKVRVKLTDLDTEAAS